MANTDMKYLLGLLLFGQALFGQGWKPAMEGMGPLQREGSGGQYNVKFKENGPLGRDWIYGRYVDHDSLTRNVAYREGGEWVPLPFSGYYGNYATDIEMYGDTLLISGGFGDIVLDKDSGLLPETSILKYYNDSIWPAPLRVFGPKDMAVKGDTLLISGGSYYSSPQRIYTQFMTPNKGQTWQYPYSIVHPTESQPDFGPIARLEILDNGDIMTLNNGSPPGSSFKGISRWDGQQWHAYGNGVASDQVRDFAFYRGELYMAGVFAQYYTLHGDTIGYVGQNPGNGIVRWDGIQWHGLANGILEGGVWDIFVHDSILYCHIFNGNESYHQAGDALIPHLAGWDGHQWCGTPVTFSPPGFGPVNMGFVNDTLFASFLYGNNYGAADGQPVTYMMYFDGNYVKGPNSICSTLGIGVRETSTQEGRIGVYPNPASGILNISLPKVASNATVRLYSLGGQLVLEQKLEHSENQVKLPRGLSGLYLAVVENAGQVLTKKVLVENQ